MKSIYTSIITAVCMLCLAACNPDEFGDRKESTPVVESASIASATFNFGDSVTLTAKISDPATHLVSLTYEVVSNNKTLTSGVIPLSGSEYEVAEQLLIPLLSNQADNAAVTVILTVRNVLHGEVSHTITGLTGKRKNYSQLYLLTSLGNVITLTPQADNKNIYEAKGLTLANAFSYQIAERVTPDGQIDYSGAVWGNEKGRLGTVDSKGEAAFASVANAVYIQSIVFDNMAFEINFVGDKTLAPNYISLSTFTDEPINGEDCRKYSLQLENNQEYTLVGALGSNQVVCNMDFFERTADNKVKFLGQTGSYTLYYNAYRKFLVVGLENPAYPNYLLMTGSGIGYPSKVSGIDKVHSSWGFGNSMQFILFRKISDNVFQGTLYIGAGAGFKPFENNGWANEKRLDSFASITGEQVLKGDNDWTPNEKVDPNAFYQITIDLNTSTVNVKKITL